MNAPGIELLLVEDDAAEQKLVRESLGPAFRSPYRLDIADRLEGGMQRLADRRYDAVLLSLTLTEDPGLECYLRIRESFPDVPALVLTRPGAEILGSKAMDLGAIDALVKDPGLTEGLPRRLRYAVERSRLRAELRGLDMLDDLTGLYNRRGFVALSTPVLKVARRMRSGVLLIVAAVEGNGWSAPAEEARAVRAAGHLLRDTFRDSDLTARVGRDDFAVLAVNATDGEIISRRLREKLLDHNARNSRSGASLTLEVGVWTVDPEVRPDVGHWLSKAKARKTG